MAVDTSLARLNLPTPQLFRNCPTGLRPTKAAAAKSTTTATTHNNSERVNPSSTQFLLEFGRYRASSIVTRHIALLFKCC